MIQNIIGLIKKLTVVYRDPDLVKFLEIALYWFLSIIIREWFAGSW